jgi:phosphocarrier protein HPr
MATINLDIINKRGLHARAAAKLATLANQYQATINVRLGNSHVDSRPWADAKSVMSLMLLAASLGTQLEIAADGDDADIALNAIRELFANKFDEGE